MSESSREAAMGDHHSDVDSTHATTTKKAGQSSSENSSRTLDKKGKGSSASSSGKINLRNAKDEAQSKGEANTNQQSVHKENEPVTSKVADRQSLRKEPLLVSIATSPRKETSPLVGDLVRSDHDLVSDRASQRSPDEKVTRFAEDSMTPTKGKDMSPLSKLSDSPGSPENSSRKKQVVLDLSENGSSGPSGRSRMESPVIARFSRIDRGVEVNTINDQNDMFSSSRQERNLRMTRNRRGLTKSLVYHRPSLFASNNPEDAALEPDPLNIEAPQEFEEDGEASMLVPRTAPDRRQTHTNVRPQMPRYPKTGQPTPMASSRYSGYHTSRFVSRGRKPLGRFETSFTSDTDDFKSDHSPKQGKFSLVMDQMAMRARFLSSPREESLESLPPLDFNERDSVLIAQSEAMADGQMPPVAFSSLASLAHINGLVGKQCVSLPSSPRSMRTRSRQRGKIQDTKAGSVRFM